MLVHQRVFGDKLLISDDIRLLSYSTMVDSLGSHIFMDRPEGIPLLMYYIYIYIYHIYIYNSYNIYIYTIDYIIVLYTHMRPYE